MRSTKKRIGKLARKIAKIIYFFLIKKMANQTIP